MRVREAVIRYQGEAQGVIPDIEMGGYLSSGGTRNATLLTWTGKRFEAADMLAQIDEKTKNDVIHVTGISAKAEQMFGIGNAEVEITVTPRAGCKGCS